MATTKHEDNPEDRLRELRDELDELSDRFKELGKTEGVCIAKITVEHLDNALDEIDDWMDWEQ